MVLIVKLFLENRLDIDIRYHWIFEKQTTLRVPIHNQKCHLSLHWLKF